MLVEVAEVLILGTDKLLPEEFPRVFPGGALLSENALAEERTKNPRAAAETVILEVG